MFSSNTSQVSGGYEIQRSLRFNSADSAFLNRTPASASNRKTWTWSGWVKKSRIADNFPMLFTAGASAPFDQLYFDDGDRLTWYTGGVAIFLTNAVYRDPSAWYHIVMAVDTPQASAGNRIKLYVNGVEQTFASSTNLSQNQDTATNNTVAHNIGRLPSGLYHFNGYMTEINFIDGQALTPSSFGAFDAQTGVWGPTRYAGSYGTNGFYLNFSDNSNTTAATLGRDYSGNGNNWTPNNFSVSAGAGNDSLVDVPTNWGTDTGVGGSVRGNYCTLNPLDKGPNVTITNGNLSTTNNYAGTPFECSRATIGVATGKWYWEVTATTVVSNSPSVGIASAAASLTNYLGADAQGWGYVLATGQKANNATLTSYGASIANGDIVGVALDMDAGTLVFFKNGVSQGTAFTGLTGTLFPAVFAFNTSVMECNFGQRPFAYTAPSGFRALNTQNLPTPTIGATTATQAGKYFNPVLWTGNSSTQNITGVGFDPDFIWMKNRSVGGRNHYLFDRLRGITNARLFSNLTDAENTSTTYINSTNSDGYQLASGDAGSNGSGETYVAWNWRANGAGVTNTAGSITSTVSANTTSGFSIATFTGNGTAGATVGHGLSAVPRMIIVKSRGNARDWLVYHASIGATQFLQLNTTIAATTATTPWNDTAPTSSVFSLGTSLAGNESGVTRVAYCFAEVPGYSRFGSYTGNGSTDGPFVFCGFRPAYVMAKCTNVAGDWFIVDATRSPRNQTFNELVANSSGAEYTGTDFDSMDMLANGFKLRVTNTSANANGNSYIFMAFASAPQKFALAR